MYNLDIGQDHTFFTQSKYDLLINNHCEIFNSFMLEARDKSTILLMEKIRNLMMVRIRNNMDKMKKHPGVICPRIEKKVKQIVKDSNNFICEGCLGRVPDYKPIYAIYSGLGSYNLFL